MLKYLLIFVLAFSSACASGTEPKNDTWPSPANGGDILYQCVYKYDNKLKIVFYESNRETYHPALFPNLTVYKITDINGKRWLINEYEWAGYICSKSLNDKEKL